MPRPEDFSLVLADFSHAPAIRDNHDTVTIANNAMLTASGEQRDINWQLPMDIDRVVGAIAAQRQFIFGLS